MIWLWTHPQTVDSIVDSMVDSNRLMLAKGDRVGTETRKCNFLVCALIRRIYDYMIVIKP